MKRILACSLALLPFAANAQEAAPAAATDASDVLVFNYTLKDGSLDCAQTTWIAAGDKDGKSAKSVSVPVFAAGDQVYALESAEKEYEARPCNCVDMTEPSSADCPKGANTLQKGSYTVYSLKNLISGKVIWQSKSPLIDPPKSEEDNSAENGAAAAQNASYMGEFSASVSTEAIFEPYIQLDQCNYGFLCGAHGDIGCEGHLIDLKQGKEVTRADLGLDKLEKAINFDKLSWPAEGYKELSPNPESKVVSMRSELNDKGFALSLLAASDCSYASSSEDWSSYTVTAKISLGSMLPELGKKADVTAAQIPLAAFAGKKIVGTTKISKDAKVQEALKAYFDKAPKACK